MAHIQEKPILRRITLEQAAAGLEATLQELAETGNHFFIDQHGDIWWDDAGDCHGWELTSNGGWWCSKHEAEIVEGRA